MLVVLLANVLHSRHRARPHQAIVGTSPTSESFCVDQGVLTRSRYRGETERHTAVICTTESARHHSTLRAPWELPCLAPFQAEMRDRLATAKGAVYTYSMDYVSQSVSLVDETRLKEDQEVQYIT